MNYSSPKQKHYMETLAVCNVLNLFSEAVLLKIVHWWYLSGKPPLFTFSLLKFWIFNLDCLSPAAWLCAFFFLSVSHFIPSLCCFFYYWFLKVKMNGWDETSFLSCPSLCPHAMLHATPVIFNTNLYAGAVFIHWSEHYLWLLFWVPVHFLTIPN